VSLRDTFATLADFLSTIAAAGFSQVSEPSTYSQKLPSLTGGLIYQYGDFVIRSMPDGACSFYPYLMNIIDHLAYDQQHQQAEAMDVCDSSDVSMDSAHCAIDESMESVGDLGYQNYGDLRDFIKTLVTTGINGQFGTNYHQTQFLADRMGFAFTTPELFYAELADVPSHDLTSSKTSQRVYRPTLLSVRIGSSNHLLLAYDKRARKTSLALRDLETAFLDALDYDINAPFAFAPIISKKKKSRA